MSKKADSREGEELFSAEEEGDSQQLAQVTVLARVDLCSGAGPPVDVRDFVPWISLSH